MIYIAALLSGILAGRCFDNWLHAVIAGQIVFWPIVAIWWMAS